MPRMPLVDPLVSSTSASRVPIGQHTAAIGAQALKEQIPACLQLSMLKVTHRVCSLTSDA